MHSPLSTFDVALRALRERAQPRPTPTPESKLGRRKLVIAVGVIFASLLAAMLGWWATHRQPSTRYLTAAISVGPIERTITATGTVNPELTVIVGSYVSGVIESMYCDYNTRVKRGQLCAKVDPRPYQAALEQAKGQLARDLGQLQGARADLARYKTLRGEDSIAVQTYEDQQALVQQLEGSVQMDRANMQSASVNLEYTNIVSPVDGTVVARNVTIGQTVAASFQTPTLFLIATDLTKMEVDSNVNESDIGAVKVGDEAKFTVEAFERAFTGRVAQVRQAPQTVQNVVTYDVVVAVDNPLFLLKPGMTATVSIVTDRRANVLRIPDQALRFAPSGAEEAHTPGSSHSSTSAGGAAAARSAGAQHARAWVLSNGKPTAIALTTGLDDDTNTELIAGDLAVGSQVIIGEQVSHSTSSTAPIRFGF